MSEKRFVQVGDTSIKDTLTGEKYYAPCEDGLLELLNEQQATINELQSIINHIKCEENCEDYDYCCETVCSLYNEIKHLKEENEQLRQILKDIVVATDETYTKNRSIYKVSVVFGNETYLKIKECLNE